MNAQNRFYSRKWGVFNHYLYSLQNDPTRPNSYGKETDWDTLVNEFDTEHLAKTLHEMGAGYYFITVQQGNKYMIAPNATFDRIAGTKPGEACSTRDLIEDLYNSLSKYDIDLFLYFTGDGPYRSSPENERFGFKEPRTDGVTRPFVEKWASVLEEYSLRYGNKVKGWWIDGCYDGDPFPENLYTQELLEILYRACKAGNKDSLTAFNKGVFDELIVHYHDEEFTAGEQNNFDLIPTGRFYGKAQAHILAPLGISWYEKKQIWRHGWGCLGEQRSKEYLADYLQKVRAAGGVVTFDIAVYRDGKFDPKQQEIVAYAGKFV